MPDIGNAVAVLSSFYDTVGAEKFAALAASHTLPSEVEEAFGTIREMFKTQTPDGQMPDLCVIVIH